MTAAKRSGPKPKPPEELRVLVAVRLPPAAVDQLRALATVLDMSQSDVIAGALALLDADQRKPAPKRKGPRAVRGQA